MKNIKKIFAVAVSAALVGATMVGALAYNLDNYPAPFVQNGAFNGAIVVGANAATSDVLGAIDIAASLQAAAKTGTAIAGSTTVSLDGGEKIDDRALNSDVLSATYDDSDLTGFQNKDIRWNDKDITIHEELDVAGSSLGVDTYYPGSGSDDAFGSDPYLTTSTANGLEYKYVFEDSVNATNVASSGTDKDELDINFLGKDLKITHIENGAMTVEASNEVYMEEGDSVTVDGHVVTLKRVGDGSLLVQVDNQVKSVTVSGSPTVQFDQADDFEVQAQSSFYIQDAADNSATLTLGATISDTVNNGDSLEQFGENSDSDKAAWVWDISVSGGNVAYIGAVSNMKRVKKDITSDEERPALAMGDSIMFPNDYASITFDGWEDSKQTNYEELNVGFDNVKLGSNYYDVAVFDTTANKDSFYLDGTKKVQKVYVRRTGDSQSDYEIWYNDGSDKVNGSTYTTFDFELDKEPIVITPSANSSIAWTMDVNSGVETFDVAIDGSANDKFDQIGITSDDAVTGDLLYASHDISTSSDDMRTTYGILVNDPESQLNKDELTLNVPQEQQYPVITIASAGTVVSEGAEGGMSYTVNPIGLGLGMLDTDATLGAKPMIIVGGPVVNDMAAEVMGNPTQDQLAATFSEGKALIKWYDDKQAMLVAGWGKLETQGACYVVARHGDYAGFTGNEVQVVVTSLDNLDVTSVN